MDKGSEGVVIVAFASGGGGSVADASTMIRGESGGGGGESERNTCAVFIRSLYLSSMAMMMCLYLELSF